MGAHSRNHTMFQHQKPAKKRMSIIESKILLKKERQLEIIHQINLHNKILSSDLSLILNVSEDTIRRDLNELALENKIVKVHGGALSKSYNVSAHVLCVD
eukprot:Opistho-1_new@22737